MPIVATIDISSTEGYIAAIIALAIFTIPLLTNFIKVALDAYTSVKELRPTVHANSKKLAEHDRMLNGGLDERISSQIQAVVGANGSRAGNDATTGAVPTDGGESGTASASG